MTAVFARCPRACLNAPDVSDGVKTQDSWPRAQSLTGQSESWWRIDKGLVGEVCLITKSWLCGSTERESAHCFTPHCGTVCTRCTMMGPVQCTLVHWCRHDQHKLKKQGWVMSSVLQTRNIERRGEGWQGHLVREDFLSLYNCTPGSLLSSDHRSHHLPDSANERAGLCHSGQSEASSDRGKWHMTLLSLDPMFPGPKTSPDDTTHPCYSCHVCSD